MHTSPKSSWNSPPSSEVAVRSRAQAETIVYQGVTIAAMLLLLGSMWVF